MTPPRSRGRPTALAAFFRTEEGAGAVLVTAAVVAVVWATLRPLGYTGFWATPLALPVPGLDHFTLKSWVDDGLMTLFFLVVGLEIKREMTVGELSDRRAATLPVIAAVGGIVVPALIYLAFTAGDASAQGWAIPAATDIAFVLGVCALLGDRVPTSLRLFLLTLAIADDIGGILLIAVVYSSGISVVWLLAATTGAAALIGLQRLGVTRVFPYVPLWVWIWYATLLSGVHPTIAGVVIGVLTPAGSPKAPFDGGEATATGIEARLHPFTSFVVAPVFALANVGVSLTLSAVSAALGAPVFWGVFVGLVAGKPIGISLAVWAGKRAGAGILPRGTTLGGVIAASPLGGIGFTVALFIATLSLTDPVMLEHALIAILAASVTAAALGAGALALRYRRVS